ncbi:YkgJ family cysteine cluster protein [Caproiciproducens sp. R1]|uniref:YkgJ family cysteine cluster protein n=1 Tax=Caproiciproducens sp. R1 TaxID=3435000 RepID=UPI00403343CD
MNFEGYQVRPVRTKDWVTFHCQRCGACCRHLEQKVMLESLDAFRLAKFLKKRGDDVTGMDDVLDRYATPVPLAEGYPIFVLQVAGSEDACIFLKDGGCSVYEARPRVCRLYPFTVSPGTKGRDFEYLLCTEAPHHFADGRVLVNDWMYQNFKREDKEFVKREYDFARDIGRCLRQLSSSRLSQALFPILYYLYSNYDLEKSFLPQYDRNLDSLIKELRELINGR